MELLLFGHAGRPVLVFPTSGGRFYEFEDRGMVQALGPKIDSGQIQLVCVDSVDRESWYSRGIPPRERIARQLQYEEYIVNEAAPLARRGRPAQTPLTAFGCSFGGYHAVNLALRRPDLFAGFVSLSGVFDLTIFLDGYYDQECYYNLPTHFLPNLTDERLLSLMRRARYVLASGWDDQCLEQNQKLDRILVEKGLAHQFHIWSDGGSHDWPTWRRMAAEYV